MSRSNWLGLPEHELLADGEPSSASAGDQFSRLTRSMSQKVTSTCYHAGLAVHGLSRPCISYQAPLLPVPHPRATAATSSILPDLIHKCTT
jgi:hypothetical protein